MQSKGRVIRRMIFKNASMLAVASVACLAITVVRGQQTSAPSSQVSSPTFDVVSIKPNKSVSDNMSIAFRGESFTATNITLADLLINSYPVSEEYIFGLPGWSRSARFDIDAKIVNPDMAQLDKLTREQRRAMLLKVLQDRFHLQAHLETKTLPVYDLVVARDGPKFTGSDGPNADIRAAIAKSGFTGGGIMVNDGELICHVMPLSSLAYSLSGVVGRTVIDKTGLTGKYDFELKWTPEAEAGASVDNGQSDPQSTSSSIFTAVQEQLGLKLQSAKGPVDTLVVDHVEMPSDN